MPQDDQRSETPNQAANKEKAEDSQANAGGTSNRPLETEQRNQERVPPRGDRKGDTHA